MLVTERQQLEPERRRQTKHSTRQGIYCRADDDDDARPVPRVPAILVSRPEVCVAGRASDQTLVTTTKIRRRGDGHAASFIRFAGRK